MIFAPILHSTYQTRIMQIWLIHN